MRRLSIAALSVVLLGVSVTADDPGAPWLHARELGEAAGMGGEAPRHSGPGSPPRGHAPSHGAAAPRRLALRQGRTPNGSCGQFRRLGWDAADRDLRPCSSRRRRSGCSRWWRRRGSWPSSRSPRSPATPRPGRKRAAADLQRLLRSTATSPAPLVYVNYGVPADYEELERLGISVKGAIVIARYGGSWRGIKPKVAAEHGAVGCLIYSDPRDDGYFQGDVFPKGPMRPRDGVQRGSVMDMPSYPGDPLTPGVGATADAKRLDREGREDASRRSRCCRSRTATRSRCSPRSAVRSRRRSGAARCRSRITSARARRRCISSSRSTGTSSRSTTSSRASRGRAARRVGHPRQPPRRLGERRRGSDLRPWSPLLEEARAHRRAGEAGLAAEAHHRLLRVGRRGAGAARLHRVGGGARGGAARARRSPTSTPTATAAASSAWAARTRSSGSSTRWRATSRIPRPAVGVEASPAARPVTAPNADARKEAARAARPAHRRARLGLRLHARSCSTSASPSLNLGFGGEDDGGIYHSIYDDFYWYTHFTDTDFVYGRALAQTVIHRGDAPRERRAAAVRVQRARRHHERVPEGTARAGRGPAQRYCRAQPADRGRRVHCASGSQATHASPPCTPRCLRISTSRHSRMRWRLSPEVPSVTRPLWAKRGRQASRRRRCACSIVSSSTASGV